MDFFQQKQERLKHADLSRKGSIDEFIVDTVERINSISNYFTTSSCSGRIIILESTEEESLAKPVKKKIAKKGCKWLLVSHDKICMEAVVSYTSPYYSFLVRTRREGKPLSKEEKGLMNVTNEAIFKFEPMIMHVQCQSLQDAQILHHAAVAAGFRNSGISIGNKGKTIVAVRSTHGLEVPLSSNGDILVSKQYLGFLVDCANKKMDENFARINRFLEEVKLIADRPAGPCNSHQTDKKKDLTKQKEVLKARKGEKREDGQDNQESDEDFLDDDLSLFVFENT